MLTDCISSIGLIGLRVCFFVLFAQSSFLFSLDKFEQSFLSACQKFKRDFTVLDLMENGGKLRELALENFDLCYVLAQENISLKVFGGQRRLIVLGKRFDFDMMRVISQCEDFDIVLLELSNLETCPKKIKLLMDLGQVVLLKVNDFDCNLLQSIVSLINRECIALVLEVNSSCLMLVRSHQKYITRGWINGPRKHYQVYSTFTEKFLKKPKKTTKWTFGMNLWNFLCLKGLYPLRADILKSVTRLFKKTYHDFYPWNILIQGSGLVAIDQVPERFNPSINQLRVTTFILQRNILRYPLQKGFLVRFLKKK